MTHQDPQASFESAIKAGILSTNETSDVYAGNYMYMGHQGDEPMFKNINTREYLSIAEEA